MNIPGVKVVDKLLADGTTKRYHYDRISGRRVQGEPGTLEFETNLETVRTAGPTRVPRTRSIELAGGETINLPAQLSYRRTSFIYFMQAASGPIKIGITDNVDRRLSAIRHALYEDVTLLATFAGDITLERRLHRLFKPHRLRGEWFNPHPHIFREIHDLAADAKLLPSRARKLRGNLETAAANQLTTL